MIWFTSDTHFNHGNIVQFCNRPYEDLAEMTAALIENWNSCVKPGDVIYHLGDFALTWGKQHDELIDSLLTQLNGNKFLITGNHDREPVTRNPRWTKVAPYHELTVDIGGVKQPIVLCHYAMRVWNRSHYGAWMLHGHSHGTLRDLGGKILDVGVDCSGYRPVDIDTVAFIMQSRKISCDDSYSKENQT